MADATTHVGQPVEAGLVGPMQVLDDDSDRPVAGGEQIGEFGEELIAVTVRDAQLA